VIPTVTVGTLCYPKQRWLDFFREVLKSPFYSLHSKTMKRIFTRLVILQLALLVLISPVIAASASEPVASNPSHEPTPTEVKAAVDEFKSLSRKERKMRIREAKKELKKFKADKKSGRAAEESTVLLVILAILLPPLAVYLHEDEINTRFWISIVLTLLFWIPGVIYALIIVLSDSKGK